jgi:hypothetical protein
MVALKSDLPGFQQIKKCKKVMPLTELGQFPLKSDTQSSLAYVNMAL